MTADERIARISRRQHGAIASWQLQAIDVTPAERQARLRSGSLTTVRRGVDVVTGAPRTQHQAVMAAVLSAGPNALVSHDAALWLHGLRRDFPAHLDVTTTRAQHVRVRGLRAHRTRLLKCERFRRDGIPTTSVARTIIDVSASTAPAELERIIDEALRRRILRLTDLRFLVAGLRPARGRDVGRLRTALAARVPGYDPTESELESLVLRTIVDAGLPEPERQLKLVIDGRRCRVDLGYRAFKITIECDSWTYHGGQQRRPFDADRARANELTTSGYTHLQFTSGHSPTHIASTVRRALVNARAQLDLAP